MSDCELVFLDPDNGLLPRSVSEGSRKSIKYALPEEIIDYYRAGHSAVFYSHRTREQLNTYLSRFEELFDSDKIAGSTIMGISFCRGTIRDYFFILHEEHKGKIIRGINNLLQSGWKQHFKNIENSSFKRSEVMAKWSCRCGQAINDHRTPDANYFRIFSDEVWNQITTDENGNLNFFEDMPLQTYDVYRCPACGRIMVFGEGKICASYVPEDDT